MGIIDFSELNWLYLKRKISQQPNISQAKGHLNLPALRAGKKNPFKTRIIVPPVENKNLVWAYPINHFVSNKHIQKLVIAVSALLEQDFEITIWNGKELVKLNPRENLLGQLLGAQKIDDAELEAELIKKNISSQTCVKIDYKKILRLLEKTQQIINGYNDIEFENDRIKIGASQYDEYDSQTLEAGNYVLNNKPNESDLNRQPWLAEMKYNLHAANFIDSHRDKSSQIQKILMNVAVRPEEFDILASSNLSSLLMIDFYGSGRHNEESITNLLVHVAPQLESLSFTQDECQVKLENLDNNVIFKKLKKLELKVDLIDEKNLILLIQKSPMLHSLILKAARQDKYNNGIKALLRVNDFSELQELTLDNLIISHSDFTRFLEKMPALTALKIVNCTFIGPTPLEFAWPPSLKKIEVIVPKDMSGEVVSTWGKDKDLSDTYLGIMGTAVSAKVNNISILSNSVNLERLSIVNIITWSTLLKILPRYPKLASLKIKLNTLINESEVVPAPLVKALIIEKAVNPIDAGKILDQFPALQFLHLEYGTIGQDIKKRRYDSLETLIIGLDNQGTRDFFLQFPNLRNLTLTTSCQALTNENETISSFSGLNKLEYLGLAKTNITVSIVKKMIEILPALTFIDLSNCPAINAQNILEITAQYPQLRVISNHKKELTPKEKMENEEQKKRAERQRQQKDYYEFGDWQASGQNSLNTTSQKNKYTIDRTKTSFKTKTSGNLEPIPKRHYRSKISYFDKRSFTLMEHDPNVSTSFLRSWFRPTDSNLELVALKAELYDLKKLSEENPDAKIMHARYRFASIKKGYYYALPDTSSEDIILKINSSQPGCKIFRDKNTGLHYIRFDQDSSVPVALTYSLEVKQKIYHSKNTMRVSAKDLDLQFDKNNNLIIPDKLKNASDEEKIDLLIEFFKEFTDGNLNEDSKESLVNRYLKQKVGKCADRAWLFAALSEDLNIRSRVPQNPLHAFVEVFYENQWQLIELGGSDNYEFSERKKTGTSRKTVDLGQDDFLKKTRNLLLS